MSKPRVHIVDKKIKYWTDKNGYQYRRGCQVVRETEKYWIDEFGQLWHKPFTRAEKREYEIRRGRVHRSMRWGE